MHYPATALKVAAQQMIAHYLGCGHCLPRPFGV